MGDTSSGDNQPRTTRAQTLAYIGEMLVELRQLARSEREEMLAYLIEMAIVEVSDLKKETH